MDGVAIVDLTPDRVGEAVAVLEAFRGEPTTSTLFRWPEEGMPRGWAQGMTLMLEAKLRAGSPVLAAVSGDRVVGLAGLSAPGERIPLRQIGRMIPRMLVVLIAVLRSIRLRGVLLLPALRPPRRLPKPHYTLEVLAVEPAMQGQGVGRRLLDAAHARIDGDPTARGTYLFTAEDRTRTFYERYGYRVVRMRHWRELTIWHMFRTAQQ